MSPMWGLFFFFFNDTATTEIYTLSLHDALPISRWTRARFEGQILPPMPGHQPYVPATQSPAELTARALVRSEEHTSELQSLAYLVCRLLLEKKKAATLRQPHESSCLPWQIVPSLEICNVVF